MRLFWYASAWELNKSLESEAKSKHFPAPLTPPFAKQSGPATAIPLRVKVEKPAALVLDFMKNPYATAPQPAGDWRKIQNNRGREEKGASEHMVRNKSLATLRSANKEM